MFIPDDQIRNQHENKSIRCISNLCKEFLEKVHENNNIFYTVYIYMYER